ncbi:hypothetical protein FRC08_018121 [Ceratobasidium sp. 394]|nr:hypothetical protein FRC08_018121 [Ceratobasidium sp. 394]
MRSGPVFIVGPPEADVTNALSLKPTVYLWSDVRQPLGQPASLRLKLRTEKVSPTRS